MLIHVLVVITFRMDSNYFGQIIAPKDKVENIAQLLEGQHIAFSRGRYCHHAIIENVKEKEVHTIEYNLKVMRRVYDIDKDIEIGDFYLIKHEKYSAQSTIKRAKNGLKVQDKYNPLYRNCEHFANECVLGEAGSGESVQHWRMLVLLIGQFLVEICLFLFRFGMVKLLATARPIAGGLDSSGFVSFNLRRLLHVLRYS